MVPSLSWKMGGLRTSSFDHVEKDPSDPFL